jgi:hypothetical protein
MQAEIVDLDDLSLALDGTESQYQIKKTLAA